MKVDHGEKQALGVRTRILDAASELFYRRGIHAVGIDRVIAQAGVAKASLYHHFRTKEELIAAVLRRRDDRWRQWLIESVEARASAPDERLLAVFDVLAEWFATDEFRGCAFINAAAEFPDPTHPVRAVVKEHKRAVIEYLCNLTRDAKIDDPAACALELFLLIEGTIATAFIENDPRSSATAKAAAATLLRVKITA